MPELSRRQILAWAAVGMIILLVGGNYLRSHLTSGSTPESGFSAATIGLKEEGPTELKVHVAGAVVRPGLYTLKPGQRAADAIELAGGPTPAADLGQVNLAARLADGQQLVVPEKGMPPPAAGAGSAATGTGTGGSGGPVNLNSATLEQLEQLDGVGPKTAQKIIDYREAHGGFKSIEELMEVPGIGPAKFEGIKDQVTV